MQKIKLGTHRIECLAESLWAAIRSAGVNNANNWDPWSEEGRQTAIATVNHAIDRGINYIDTAPGYGEGNSERHHRRSDEDPARTKWCWPPRFAGTKHGKQAVIDSVHDSLKRLQTDRLDIVQFHGGMFTAEEYAQIVEGGPLEGLLELKQQGKIGFIGLTAEEPWTAIAIPRPARKSTSTSWPITSSTSSRQAYAHRGARGQCRRRHHAHDDLGHLAAWRQLSGAGMADRRRICSRSAWNSCCRIVACTRPSSACAGQPRSISMSSWSNDFHPAIRLRRNCRA